MSITKTRHGLSRIPEYRVWASMKSRCSNQKDNNYPKYGGRGITVCNKWQRSFADFIEDLGRRPSPNHSIDRIDNNGNYEPRNCRWASKQIQSINQRKRNDNTTGYIGVSLNGSNWGAWISHNSKTHYIGTYCTPKEAAYIRDQVALQIYGKDAKLNFDY